MRTLGCLQTVAIALGIREFNYSTRQIVSAFPHLFKPNLLIIHLQENLAAGRGHSQAGT
jgi:hypothetical protein